MKVECLQCGHKFVTGRFSYDNLGWYISDCPSCHGSFDIEQVKFDKGDSVRLKESALKEITGATSGNLFLVYEVNIADDKAVECGAVTDKIAFRTKIRDITYWLPLKDIECLFKEVDESLYEEVASMKCNLCDEMSMEYYKHNETHIWVCRHCPNIQFEYYDSQNTKDLTEFLEGKSGK